MRRALFLTCVAALASSCTATPPLPLETPAPTLLLNHGLPDEARICVPRAVFVNDGIACITVGALRAQLRRQTEISVGAQP